MKKLLIIICITLAMSIFQSCDKIGGNSDYETIMQTDELRTELGIIGDGIPGGCYEQDYYRSTDQIVSPITKNKLFPPYPNPSNGSIAIDVSIAYDGNFKLLVVNTDNEVINTLFDGSKTVGNYVFIWSTNYTDGQSFSDGYYRIIADFNDTECFYNVRLLKNP